MAAEGKAMAGQRQFGKYLRELRLNAGFGLRVFAELIDMKPSNLSRLERGRICPPQSVERIDQIADALGLERRSAEYEKLNDLAVKERSGTPPPDVAEYAAQQAGVPLLLRTAKGKCLDESQFRRLAEYIQKHL